MKQKKKIAILGSTGSIGTKTLQVIRHLKDELEVTALAAKSNIDLLESQAREFHPEIIAVFDKDKAFELQKRLPNTKIVGGMEGLIEAAAGNSDLVMAAFSGTVGILPTIAAIEAGKDIALANKEVLVSAGKIVMSLVKEKKVKLIPVDSEHNALFQCLVHEKYEEVSRLILTASGGPFHKIPLEELKHISIEDALKHPTYPMGFKNTIDSSTLMNKGLEVIEAHFLFDLPVDQIEVVVHPQSVIHSLVEYQDGSILSQLSEPNMLIPIQYALTFPKRRPGLAKPFDFLANSRLEFYAPDFNKFPCLALAYEAIKQGGSLPCYMNAANEVLVDRFRNGQIRWNEIPKFLERLMARHCKENEPNLDKILLIDASARIEAARI